MIVEELLLELRAGLPEGLPDALRHTQYQETTAYNTQGMVDSTEWSVSTFAKGAAVKCQDSRMRAARTLVPSSSNLSRCFGNC
jgi:hypothetical protein